MTTTADFPAACFLQLTHKFKLHLSNFELNTQSQPWTWTTWHSEYVSISPSVSALFVDPVTKHDQKPGVMMISVSDYSKP